MGHSRGWKKVPQTSKIAHFKMTLNVNVFCDSLNVFIEMYILKNYFDKIAFSPLFNFSSSMRF